MKFPFCIALALALGWTPALLAAAPPNDNLSNATLISGTNITVIGTNVDATKELGEPVHAGNAGGKSVWWKWTAPGAGSAVVTTSDSTTADNKPLDTLLAAYTGSSIATLSEVASDDDTGGLKTSLLGFNVSPGITYLIAVDGYNGASGNIHLSLDYRPTPLTRPPNDNFTNSIALTGINASATTENFFATQEKNEPTVIADWTGGRSLWWSWTAPLSGAVTIDTKGSDFDTLLSVYTGSGLTNLTVVAANDDIVDNVTLQSQVTFPAVAHTSYHIVVDGFEGAPGRVQLNVAMTNLFSLSLPQRLTAGGYAVSVLGPIGKAFALDVSTNLPFWSQLGIQTNSTGTLQFDDPAAARNAPRRFYRARQL